jgi:hypothetical protein
MYRNPQGVMEGIDDLPEENRPPGFDTDGDGMPNDFEAQHALNPDDPQDGNDTRLSDLGYTNLETYLNSLVPAE